MPFQYNSGMRGKVRQDEIQVKQKPIIGQTVKSKDNRIVSIAFFACQIRCVNIFHWMYKIERMINFIHFGGVLFPISTHLIKYSYGIARADVLIMQSSLFNLFLSFSLRHFLLMSYFCVYILYSLDTSKCTLKINMFLRKYVEPNKSVNRFYILWKEKTRTVCMKSQNNQYFY